MYTADRFPFLRTDADGNTLGWHIEPLWKLAKNLPVERIKIDTVKDGEFVRKRMQKYLNNHDRHGTDFIRIRECKLDHPILFNQHGELLDGRHRFCKAYFMGEKAILARRFVTDPDPDFVLVNDKEVPWSEWKEKNLTTESYTPTASLPASARWKKE